MTTDTQRNIVLQYSFIGVPFVGPMHEPSPVFGNEISNSTAFANLWGAFARYNPIVHCGHSSIIALPMPILLRKCFRTFSSFPLGRNPDLRLPTTFPRTELIRSVIVA